ncbi:sulfite exporter TauE/SafE family protein [Sandarakinorhabdus rubra]|uniref:sulfite exporter TauE/SafE family protein n=1 Tax=Sandarakinorhabdus rubra TaxID=2672568 RepID=UPI0013DA70EF|nr:sulfite exporter TauE/SafE family protein [Sandarakinorhabdus rubra]
MELPELTLAQLQSILPFLAVGFLAQLVDGALGMAFGLITNLMLVSVVGLSPARSSATVHVVECFTTAASAVSHILHRNVDWPLLARVAGPGVIGGVLGAYVLTEIDGRTARPLVMAYLAVIGAYLLWRAWRMTHGPAVRPVRLVRPLGLVGGFLDAAGGGGWGPIVTANLLVQGSEPRTTIGTVNTAEFLVTMAVSATFLWKLGPEAFSIAAVGLIIGGLLAAPIGARIASRMQARRLLLLIGSILMLSSVYGLWAALG